MSSAVVYFALQPLRSLRGPQSRGQQLGVPLDGSVRTPNPEEVDSTHAYSPGVSALPDTGGYSARAVLALWDFPESFEVEDI